MPSYFVGEVDVQDAEGYAVYAREAAPLIERFGGKVLTKGGRTHAVEGPEPANRIVIIEFADADAARALIESPEYQAIVSIRRRTATARVYIVDSQ